ncbi:MAG TPA: preprotein translocase subunit SecE [Armatimonadota bacterium]|jgi:preprotein translocase subunit SecE
MALAKTAQPGFGARVSRPFVSLYQFLQGVKYELQRVVWPSKEETYAFTVVVVIAVVAVAIYMGSIDFIMTAVTRAIGLY